MKKTLIAAAASAFLALPGAAHAAEGDFSSIDVDGDGKITFEEVAAAQPLWTLTLIESLDEDGDGMLNREEYEAQAATGAGQNPSG